MDYTLKRSRRARYMRLAVHPGGAVVVTAPQHVSRSAVERFVREHTAWLERAIARMARFKALPISGRRAYVEHKEAARAFITERVIYWNRLYGFSYGRIAIKNTKRTWGSCSRKGNLNFSYTLLFLPRELADYVIVHELCHLAVHSHGAQFWTEVAKTQPEYRRLRQELNKYLPRY